MTDQQPTGRDDGREGAAPGVGVPRPPISWNPDAHPWGEPLPPGDWRLRQPSAAATTGDGPATGGPGAWGAARPEAPQPSPFGPGPVGPLVEPIPTGPPPAPEVKRPSTATLALVLSTVGLLCCGVPSVVGMLLARADLDAMNRGETDATHRARAEKAFGLGLLGTAIMVITIVVWMFLISRARAGAP